MPARVPNRRNTVPLPSPARSARPVHGQLVRTVGSQHLAGGGQQQPPAARGVGAFGGFALLADTGQDTCSRDTCSRDTCFRDTGGWSTGFTLRPEY